MEKKTYQKPKTKIVELKVKQQLLQTSGEHVTMINRSDTWN